MTTPTLTLSRGWLQSQRADAMRQGHRARFFCSPISRESTFHRMCNRLPDLENMATRGLYRELCALAFMNDDGTDSGDGRDQLADSSGVPWDIEDVLELVGITRKTWDKLTPPLFDKGYLVWAGVGEQESTAPASQASTAKPKPSKAKGKYGELGMVRLSDDEHARLTAKYGAHKLGMAIEVLDTYIGSKGDKYRNHYAVFKADSWVWERVAEQARNGGGVHAGRDAEARRTEAILADLGKGRG